MDNKYFDKFGNSLNPNSYDKTDRSEAILLQKFYQEKRQGKRPKPSDKFIDKSNVLTKEMRNKIIDLAAKYSDENVFGGRTTMCLQFAILVNYMLLKESVSSKIYFGNVEYFNDKVSFTWEHFWLEILNNEIIDCNIDSIVDNPAAPAFLEPSNYWGSINNVPKDRNIRTKKEFSLADQQALEANDPETIEWKKAIDKEY